jgi:two-component system NtrC family sensor kinase
VDRDQTHGPRAEPLNGSLADGMSAGLILVDAEDRYAYANAAVERFLYLGPGELVGRPVAKVVHGMRMPLLLAMDVLRHGARPVLTGRFPLNGLNVCVEFSRSESADGRYRGLAALIRDTTEDDQFCSQMLRVEKMAVLGELAAAMAHEINSPLGGVMESLRIIQKNAGNWEKVERFLPLVHRGLEQIETTVKEMLKFAVPREEPRARVVLEDVVGQSVDFLSYRRNETRAELRLDLRTERTIVVADEHALGQVMINLVNNALDAVSGRPGGRVRVSTHLLPARGEVMVQVADNGPGVPPNLRARVFDPFFTTKPSGKGTGLGLSICARIAARHGGRIVISDAPGGGAVFSLILPLVGQPREESHEPSDR